MRTLLFSFSMMAVVALTGCAGVPQVRLPQGVAPVTNFDTQKYLGVWYEIARLEHSFEKGLSDITATYSLLDDGGIKVVNRGYDAKKDEWRVAEGKAYPVESPDTGYLKVSFFGPFYGSYVVFDLDRIDYQYSFVTGPDKNYLWLLSRTPRASDEVLTRFISEAGKHGYDIDKLIYVDQSRALSSMPR
ncbi:apolipoprotein D and lipocalin family protein [Nitrosospira sp. Nsp11]|uniref:lipocalin family protein n=1 Tax=Nitrosospira sp. Nsp11 TaxID=1855338 RepID=UPI0009105890|nr:lipocalin family protein [Nitrosospira sp. Nsp11]SHL63612.1 apolipoprotein D and lipocalin family protein [Nitrosospira sp. Nsp11]